MGQMQQIDLGAVSKFDWSRTRVAIPALEEILDVADGMFGIGSNSTVETWAKKTLATVTNAISRKDLRKLRKAQSETAAVVNAAVGKKTPTTALEKAAKSMGASRMAMSKVNPFLQLALPAPVTPKPRAAVIPASDSVDALGGGVDPRYVVGGVVLAAGLYLLLRSK